MPRFFVPPAAIKNNEIIFDQTESRHIALVLRHKAGDTITAFNGKGQEYSCEIIKAAPRRVTAAIREIKSLPPDNFSLTLAQAIPKGSRMDAVVEKCTELGVARIIPLLTQRTIAKSKKNERWQKIACAAVKQSGRMYLPEISAACALSQALAEAKDFELALFAMPQAAGISFAEITRRYDKINKLIVFIGPEGDFTAEELAAAVQAGCVIFNMGKTVLRTDTAAIAACALFNLYYGGR